MTKYTYTHRFCRPDSPVTERTLTVESRRPLKADENLRQFEALGPEDAAREMHRRFGGRVTAACFGGQRVAITVRRGWHWALR